MILKKPKIVMFKMDLPTPCTVIELPSTRYKTAKGIIPESLKSIEQFLNT